MMIAPTDRLERFTSNFYPELNAKIAAMTAAGKDVIRLDIGSPDMPPPQFVIDALTRAANDPAVHGYQAHRGTPPLREAWAEHYQNSFGIALDPDKEILPLLGSKEGIFHIVSAVIDPGDIVLVPDPSYPTYTHGTLFAGGEIYLMPLKAERRFLPDLTAIPAEVAAKAKVIWLNYPSNPTGATTELEFFTEAVRFAEAHDILICHDNPYAEVTFDGFKAPSILNVPGAKNVAVEFNSLSKSHNMAGWRTGVMVGRTDIVESLLTLKAAYHSSHFYPIMAAAAAALTGDQSWREERNHIYQERRDIAVTRMQASGFSFTPPKAALYLWCRVPDGWASAEFCTAVLDQAQVSLVPGTVFGPGGEGYFRLSLVQPIIRLEEALDRLETLIDSGKLVIRQV